jgi:hypothetical protein
MEIVDDLIDLVDHMPEDGKGIAHSGAVVEPRSLMAILDDLLGELGDGDGSSVNGENRKGGR